MLLEPRIAAARAVRRRRPAHRRGTRRYSASSARMADTSSSTVTSSRSRSGKRYSMVACPNVSIHTTSRSAMVQCLKNKDIRPERPPADRVPRLPQRVPPRTVPPIHPAHLDLHKLVRPADHRPTDRGRRGVVGRLEADGEPWRAADHFDVGRLDGGQPESGVGGRGQDGGGVDAVAQVPDDHPHAVRGHGHNLRGPAPSHPNPSHPLSCGSSGRNHTLYVTPSCSNRVAEFASANAPSRVAAASPSTAVHSVASASGTSSGHGSTCGSRPSAVVAPPSGNAAAKIPNASIWYASPSPVAPTRSFAVAMNPASATRAARSASVIPDSSAGGATPSAAVSPSKNPNA